MRAVTTLVLTLTLLGCRKHSAMPHATESGGSATVADATRDAFGQPSGWLTEAHRRAFFVGNSFFNLNWLAAPASVVDRDGLGPLFNARSCSACHFKDGRSRPPDLGAPMSTMLLRVSVPGPHGAPVGDPVYGDQIQGSALPGVPPEAEVYVDYTEVAGAFDDGERYSLRKPRYRLEHLGYGAVSPGLLVSPRVAPALVGLGLLEAVPEALLERLADPDDRDHDGISGRQNRVPDVLRGTLVPGRFGWKAEQPSVVQQSSAAFVADLGITSSLFPAENHTPNEEACRDLPNGGTPELGPDILAAIGIYARALAVPARRNVDDPLVSRGEDLFGELGCAGCHVPTLRTAPLADIPELPAEDIHPYTDLLLHDLGAGLADERPAFEADGREWRTPPLWGMGLVKKVNAHEFLLHDGRARNAMEAVLWHDGEAASARARFTALPRAERQALLAFLASL
jgi:CxxC motif-containing protein (DUF1111 family)